MGDKFYFILKKKKNTKIEKTKLKKIEQNAAMQNAVNKVERCRNTKKVPILDIR